MSFIPLACYASELVNLFLSSRNLKLSQSCQHPFLEQVPQNPISSSMLMLPECSLLHIPNIYIIIIQLQL